MPAAAHGRAPRVRAVISKRVKPAFARLRRSPPQCADARFFKLRAFPSKRTTSKLLRRRRLLPTACAPSWMPLTPCPLSRPGASEVPKPPDLPELQAMPDLGRNVRHHALASAARTAPHDERLHGLHS